MTRALILIDLQHGLCEPGGVAADPLAGLVAQHRVLEHAATALRSYRAAGEPVYHVRLGFEPHYAGRTNRTPRFNAHAEAGRFLIDGPDSRICAEVAPEPTEPVFTKGSVGAFASTPLLAVLRAAGVDRVALAGVATHLAVESTAREAADRSLHVTVLADACTAPSPFHRHSVERTLPAFAAVETVDEHR